MAGRMVLAVAHFSAHQNRMEEIVLREHIPDIAVDL
jgi:hypothetical protein